MTTFREFDGTYTAPLNGFQSAEDYWARASSKPSLSGITVPTLLVNALNDPFLGPECFPREEAQANSYLHLELPTSGGHLGFPTQGHEYWSESRAVEFVTQAVPRKIPTALPVRGAAEVLPSEPSTISGILGRYSYFRPTLLPSWQQQ